MCCSAVIIAGPPAELYKSGSLDVRLLIMVLFVALVVLIIALISSLGNGTSKKTGVVSANVVGVTLNNVSDFWATGITGYYPY